MEILHAGQGTEGYKREKKGKTEKQGKLLLAFPYDTVLISGSNRKTWELVGGNEPEKEAGEKARPAFLF